MNYLAHLLLAKHSEKAMLGALLGDFVKPHQEGVFDQDILLEIILHRRIDSFTDSHPINHLAREKFNGNGRRYAGILLDVFYDHLISQKWDHYSELALDDFAQNFYATLKKNSEILPTSLLSIMPRLIEQNWLCSYHSMSDAEFTIKRISNRLSRNGEKLRQAIPVLSKEYDFLASGFESFFPELITYAKTQRKALKNTLFL